jgi:O-antigen/teichoic acid export membrane protein
VRLVTIPLITHAISLRVYGTYAALWLIIPFAHTLCDMGLGTAALRLAPDAQDQQRRHALFSTLIRTRFVTVFVMAALLIAARHDVSRLLTGTDEHSAMVILMALAMMPGTVGDSLGDYLRSEERHRTLATIIVSRTLLSNGLAVLMVVVLRRGLEGLMIARVISESAIFVGTAWFCRGALRERPDWSLLGRLLAIGAPLGMLYFLGNMRDLDRYLIRLLIGVESVGSYDLATRIVAPVALANVALAMVLEPHLFKTFRSPRAEETIALFLRGYVALFTLLGITISMLVPEILGLLAPESYHEAARAAPLLVFAFVADGVFRISGIGGDLSKRTILWAIAAAVNIAVSLPITFLLVRPLGITGAGIGLLAGTMTAAAVSRVLARRVHPLRLPVGRSLGVLAVGAVLGTLAVGGATGEAAPFALRVGAIIPLAAAAWLASGFSFAAAGRMLR